MEYENFTLRISELKENSYDVEVLDSPEGESGKVSVQFPTEDEEFKDLLTYLKDLFAREYDTEKLGQKMRPLLFPGEIWTKFLVCRSVTAAQQKGLRLRLRIDSPELSRLPWEYVCDADSRFLAQDRATPMLRYPAESLPPDNLRVEFPIRILLVTANPSDFDQLSVREEEQLVRDALEPLVATNLATITVIRHARVFNVHHELTSNHYDIFHFIGHGGVIDKRSVLILEKDDGKGRKVYAQQWWGMVQHSGLKFIFLNACETAVSPESGSILGMARSLIRAGIPGVMAMQFEVPDQLSLSFTSTLYQSLTEGTPLDQAVTRMRSTTFVTEDMVYWGIPVLYMRAKDGVIWQADDEVTEVLSAYFSESELNRWLNAAERRFAEEKSELPSSVVESFIGSLQLAQQQAAGELTKVKRELLVWRLASLIDLLVLFEVEEISTLAALRKAKKIADRSH